MVLFIATLAAREDHARARGFVTVWLLLLLGGRSCCILRSKPRAGCRSVVETPNTHGDAHLEEGGGGAVLQGRAGVVKLVRVAGEVLSRCPFDQSGDGLKKIRVYQLCFVHPHRYALWTRLSATFAIYSRFLSFLSSRRFGGSKVGTSVF